MRDRTQFWLVVLTFVGMVGLYIGAWLAYQKYLAYQKQLQDKGTLGGLLGLVTGN
jgi:hypothetical protein